MPVEAVRPAGQHEGTGRTRNFHPSPDLSPVEPDAARPALILPVDQPARRAAEPRQLDRHLPGGKTEHLQRLVGGLDEIVDGGIGDDIRPVRDDGLQRGVQGRSAFTRAGRHVSRVQPAQAKNVAGID